MPSSKKRTLILTPEQVERKIKRMAFQIYEDNCHEKELIITGIVERGYQLAQRLTAEVTAASGMKTALFGLKINKQDPHKIWKNNNLKAGSLNGKTVILVDDVLNSGRTMLYALKEILPFRIKKIKTAVLVNREHHLFPVKIDFSGLNLSTTLPDHVTVEIKSGKWYVYLQ